MTNIRETVFVVTPEGFAALKNLSGTLSLELKTVLSLVDGTCPVHQYIPFLLVFDPLPEKFRILEQLEYIKPSGQISEQATSGFEYSVAQQQPLSGPLIDSLTSEPGFSPRT